MSIVVKRNRNLFPEFFNNFFDTDVFELPSLVDFNGGLSSSLISKIPSANIAESNEDFKIEIAAPGFEKKDFKVHVDNNVLTISSEKEEETKEEEENYRRREFSYSSFERSFQLPENSIPDKIEAKYENGILQLTLPKKEVVVSKPKKEIKVA